MLLVLNLRWVGLIFLLIIEVAEPRTIMTRISDNVQLNHSTTFEQPLTWKHKPNGYRKPVIVYANEQFINGYLSSRRFQIEIHREQKRCDLVITNVTQDDSGTYYCIDNVTDDYDVIIQQRERERNLKVVPVNTKVLAGQNARLKCSTSNSHPVYWQHNPAGTDQLLDVYFGAFGFQDNYASDGRHEIANDQSTGQYDLMIRDVQLSDAGTYFCIDDSGLGQKVSADLQVLSSQKRTIMTYVNSNIRLDHVTTTIGQSLTWQHKPVGYKKPVDVYANGQFINGYLSSKRFQMEINKEQRRFDLVITNIQTDDSGTYYCIDSFTEIYEVVVQKSERNLTVVPENTVILAGHDALLKCSSSYSHPVYWQHNPAGTDRLFDVYFGYIGFQNTYASDGRHEIVGDQSTGQYDLVIRDVQLSDAGTYFCIDDSGVGLKMPADLTVLKSIPLCSSNVSTDGAIAENDCGLEPDYIKFSCHLEFTGNIPPRLEWDRHRFDGALVNTNVIYHSYSGALSADLVAKASLQMNNNLFVCRVTDQQKQTDYKCLHPEIKLLYMFNSSLKIEPSCQENMSCFANSSQSCDYPFLGSHMQPSDYTESNCMAKCNVRGVTCWVQALITYSNCNEEKDSFFLKTMLTTMLTITFGLVILAGIVLMKWRKNLQTKQHIKEVEPGVHRKLIPTTLTGAKLYSDAAHDVELKGNDIRGVVLFESEIYIVGSFRPAKIDVFDATNFKHLRTLIQRDFGVLRDMVACSLNKCLYISDEENKMIYKIIISKNCQEEYTNWPLTEKPEGLSVSTTGQLIITFIDTSKLVIYSSDGNIIKKIQLVVTIQRPWHAIQLNDGKCVVSSGDATDKDIAMGNLVCLVDQSGHFMKSYNADKNDPISCPIRMVLNRDGIMIVADYNKKRIILLDPDLKLISIYNCSSCPQRLCFDDTNQRLYVAYADQTTITVHTLKI